VVPPHLVVMVVAAAALNLGAAVAVDRAAPNLEAAWQLRQAVD
jgi:hypothetical protein